MPSLSALPPIPQAESGDALWMQRAIEQAYAAVAVGEVPVGAIIVSDGRLIADAHNLTRTIDDPTAHAEIIALRAAAGRLASTRLLDATMYVTLEPCAMCAGALVLAKLKRLVFAAADPKTGMCGSLGNIVQDPRLNHRMDVTAGVLGDEAGDLLRRFFRARRQ